jgi:hypothetical protein
MKAILPLFLALICIQACEVYEQVDFEPQLMVEAYMIHRNPLPEVRLSNTQPVFETYRFADAAVSDAIVEIALLKKNGEDSLSFAYRNVEPGIYQPLNRAYRAWAGNTYELRVRAGQGRLSAQTTIPRAFLSSQPILSEVVYQGTEQFDVEVTPTSSAERQTIYIFTVIASDAQQENLTPFYASIFENALEDDEDFEQNPDSVRQENLRELSVINSNIVNEANYQIQSNGRIRIRLPWIAIAFYGPNTVVANSIDDNLYDFVRSQDVQLGGSTLAPGEIQDVIMHVEGGIGIFGSMSTDTTRVLVVPNPLIQD